MRLNERWSLPWYTPRARAGSTWGPRASRQRRGRRARPARARSKDLRAAHASLSLAVAWRGSRRRRRPRPGATLRLAIPPWLPACNGVPMQSISVEWHTLFHWQRRAARATLFPALASPWSRRVKRGGDRSMTMALAVRVVRVLVLSRVFMPWCYEPVTSARLAG